MGKAFSYHSRGPSNLFYHSRGSIQSLLLPLQRPIQSSPTTPEARPISSPTNPEGPSHPIPSPTTTEAHLIYSPDFQHLVLGYLVHDRTLSLELKVGLCQTSTSQGWPVHALSSSTCPKKTVPLPPEHLLLIPNPVPSSSAQSHCRGGWVMGL